MDKINDIVSTLEYITYASKVFSDHQTREAFEYLYSVLCATSNDENVLINCSSYVISKNTKVCKSSVKKALTTLQTLKLLTVDGTKCHVHASQFHKNLYAIKSKKRKGVSSVRLNGK